MCLKVCLLVSPSDHEDSDMSKRFQASAEAYTVTHYIGFMEFVPTQILYLLFSDFFGSRRSCLIQFIVICSIFHDFIVVKSIKVLFTFFCSICQSFLSSPVFPFLIVSTLHSFPCLHCFALPLLFFYFRTFR